MLMAGGIVPGVKVNIKKDARQIGRMINEHVGYKTGKILRRHSIMSNVVFVEWPNGSIFSIQVTEDGDYESI